MSKIKERGRRKAALSDRKSAAAQARMKNIASLAADERVSKKKRKAGAGKSHNPSNQVFVLNTCNSEDMFGADDEDWQIYRKLVRRAYFLNESPNLTSYNRMLRLYLRMRRKNLTNFGSSKASFSCMTRHSQPSTRMHP